MKSEIITQRTSRGAGTPLEVLTSLANRVRIAAKDRTDAREQARALIEGPSVRERQEDLVKFYERYEDLVETLCDTAQYGPTPNLERRYAEQRAYMVANYPRLRPFLVGFLRFDDAELDRGAVDPFEALVQAENIPEFLRSDDGSMIMRITATREALNLYGEHLRQLAARQK